MPNTTFPADREAVSAAKTVASDRTIAEGDAAPTLSKMFKERDPLEVRGCDPRSD